MNDFKRNQTPIMSVYRNNFKINSNTIEQPQISTSNL